MKTPQERIDLMAEYGWKVLELVEGTGSCYWLIAIKRGSVMCRRFNAEHEMQYFMVDGEDVYEYEECEGEPLPINIIIKARDHWMRCSLDKLMQT